MGRPSKFKDEFVSQAEKLCRLGATDQEMADFFEIDIRTFYRWKGENESFCHALKTGKAEADDRVERSLFARANGYEHDEVDIRVVDKEVVQTPIRKYYPPDTTAAIFWLKNRRPEQWRDKSEKEETINVKHSGVVEHRSASEIGERVTELLSAGAKGDCPASLPH